MEASKIQANIIFSQYVAKELTKIVAKYHKSSLFLLTEATPHQLCLPLLQEVVDKYQIEVICVKGGEDYKSVTTCTQVWQELSAHGADRQSLLINLGGGLITDLGGFVASTFKRGIDFVNIPTTLLAQVDASIGGKTGVNFQGLKNEIGVFSEPIAVIVCTQFLHSLSHDNILSGFAEMIKHGLIKSPEHLAKLQSFNLEQLDYLQLQQLIAQSNAIKEWHVVSDFREGGVRKALNFGHTVGHAFESLALHQGRPLLHGHAVAHGMMVELYLSVECCGFPEKKRQEIARWLRSIYGQFEVKQADHEALLQLMAHDKKNTQGEINFSLLRDIGEMEINQHCSRALITEALVSFQQANAKKS